ncbi:MAG: winged helix-turn-helix transcriptional regulator [Polyangiaceae bacterium]
MSDDPLCATYLAALDVLARPWNGMIIRVLQGGPLRFSEIAARVPAIADRMLAARLKELETRALVVRTVDAGPPVRVSYELTPAGRGFTDVAEAIQRWGKVLMDAQKPRATSRRARP